MVTAGRGSSSRDPRRGGQITSILPRTDDDDQGVAPSLIVVQERKARSSSAAEPYLINMDPADASVDLRPHPMPGVPHRDPRAADSGTVEGSRGVYTLLTKRRPAKP